MRLFPAAGAEHDTDERFTPRWLFDALGLRFTLDPAAPAAPLGHVPAVTRYTRADDGLALPWHGSVWLNPPFSNVGPWAERFRAHGDGVMLFPWSANATWRRELVSELAVVVVVEHLAFEHPTHTGRHVPVACALGAMGAAATAAVERFGATGTGPIPLYAVSGGAGRPRSARIGRAPSRRPRPDTNTRATLSGP